MRSGDDRRFDWRGGGAAAGALLAALVLLGMVFLVAMSNTARDEALDGERHAYDVTLLTRSLDASISRSEAALGRFVLDEQVKTSGNIYYSQWRLAGQQIYELGKALRSEPSQRERLVRLEKLFRQRGRGIRACRARHGRGTRRRRHGLLLCRRPVADRARAARAVERDRRCRARRADRAHERDALLRRAGRAG